MVKKPARQIRRMHTAAFKARVALAAAREDKTLAGALQAVRAAPQPEHRMEAAVVWVRG
jgi:hypothetical protein